MNSFSPGKITKVDGNLNIERSAAYLSANLEMSSNAKEIISLLILQAGNPIVKIDKEEPASVLKDRFDFPFPSEAALCFYTEFSNPSKNLIPGIGRFRSLFLFLKRRLGGLFRFRLRI